MMKAILFSLVLLFGLTSLSIGGPYSLRIGSYFTPRLQIWGNQNRAQDQMILFDNEGRGALRGFAVIPPGLPFGWGVAGTVRADSPGSEGVGVSGYGETGVDRAAVWGANLFARSYHPWANAHGAEIGAGNFSGPTATNYGVYVVMEGDYPNASGLVVESSIHHPEGRPQYGLWLKSNAFGNSARETGLRVDAVDSGEALRVTSGNRIALSSDGDVFLRYNPDTDKVELVKHGVTAMEW